MNKIVIMCIGTSKIVGDSIGPIVGQLLKQANFGDTIIYGNLAEQINALNIHKYYQQLQAKHSDDIVIAIDSALGKLENIGAIKIVKDGIKPGGAFCDFHQRVGDIGIMAIVGQSDGDRMLELKTRNFAFIFNIALKIATLLKDVITDYLHNCQNS